MKTKRSLVVRCVRSVRLFVRDSRDLAKLLAGVVALASALARLAALLAGGV